MVESSDLTPAYKQAIGEAVTDWALLEVYFDQLLIRLLDSNDRYGGAAIRHIPIQARIELIRSILKDKFGENSEDFKQITDLLTRASNCLAERNKIVHGLWAMWPDGSKTLRVIFKRGAFQVAADTPDLDHLRKSRSTTILVLDELRNVVPKIGLTFFEPSQDKQK